MTVVEALGRGESSERRGETLRRRIAVILNPASGRRRQDFWRATLDGLRARGCVIDLQETDGPGAAGRLARRLGDAAPDVLVVAGGDGTINEAINGLMQDVSGASAAAAGAPGATLPPLAVVPIGTANVLAAELGLPDTADGVASAILEGPARPVTLGRMTGLDPAGDEEDPRFFVLMAGVGFDARACAAVDLKLKRRLGKGAYVWAGLRQMAASASFAYEVKVNGTSYPAHSVIVANGRYYAGRHILAPQARLESPDFQVCLFERGGAWHTIRYALGLYRGALASFPDLRIIPAEELTIEGPSSEPVQVDGDIVARLPVRISAVPAALRLVMPKGR